LFAKVKNHWARGTSAVVVFYLLLPKTFIDLSLILFPPILHPLSPTYPTWLKAEHTDLKKHAKLFLIGHTSYERFRISLQKSTSCLQRGISQNKRNFTSAICKQSCTFRLACLGSTAVKMKAYSVRVSFTLNTDVKGNVSRVWFHHDVVKKALQTTSESFRICFVCRKNSIQGICVPDLRESSLPSEASQISLVHQRSKTGSSEILSYSLCNSVKSSSAVEHFLAKQIGCLFDLLGAQKRAALSKLIMRDWSTSKVCFAAADISVVAARLLMQGGAAHVPGRETRGWVTRCFKPVSTRSNRTIQLNVSNKRGPHLLPLVLLPRLTLAQLSQWIWFVRRRHSPRCI